MKHFSVGIDSYAVQPLQLPAFEVLEWVKGHGGDGVQFSEVNLKGGQRLDRTFLRDLAARAKELGLYLEWGGGQHLPFDTATWKERDLVPVNRTAAEQAVELGTRVIRSCSGGLMRWKDDSPSTETLLRAMAEVLREQQAMLTDLGVVLAIELHFEFTTFELLRVFEMCGAEPGGCFGICLDTMNLLTMLEDPVEGTRRILPWVVATHTKDGGLYLSDKGLVSFTAEAGCGLVDFPRILELLSTLDRPVNLSVEDHGGSFEIPVFQGTFLSRFPDLAVHEFLRLVRLAREGGRRMKEGTLGPLDRADWPGCCEERVARGMENIKDIVQGHLQDSP